MKDDNDRTAIPETPPAQSRQNERAERPSAPVLPTHSPTYTRAAFETLRRKNGEEELAKRLTLFGLTKCGMRDLDRLRKLVESVIIELRAARYELLLRERSLTVVALEVLKRKIAEGE
ncbi:MAG TPA: hypothetical protein VHW00_11805 [Thermoanaerobaculia bacterium]|nr:hypothetical protein [Thermoanaerobaculia bacterium]